MNLILLSGGSGKRLWPLSNDVRSKQFLKIFRKEDGTYESMVQRMFAQIERVDAGSNFVIATSKSQVSELHSQLGEDLDISVEPCRRDTFPAIALSAAYLHDVKGIGDDEAVVVCPVDPLVDDSYFESLLKLSRLAEQETANLCLMGIEPTYPSEKYGYIMPKNKEEVSPVSGFKEKPNQALAKRYIQEGALWNAGVFAFQLGYLLKIAHSRIDFLDYEDLFAKYETLEKISFDYAVAEKEKSIAVLRYKGKWADLGTWNTLSEAMEGETIGNATLNSNCENVHVINELNVPVLCMGLKNIIVASSSEGILVTTPEESSYIKPFVDSFDPTVKFAEKSWGEYRVVDVGQDSMTVKVTLKQGHGMAYHSHNFRDEVWTIVSGQGTVVLNDKEKRVKPGDVIRIKRGTKHTIYADASDLVLVEVQLGEHIDVKDKTKYESPINLDMPHVESSSHVSAETI